MQALQQSNTGNLLLRYCSAGDFELLRPNLVRMNLDTRAPLYAPDEPIEHVYFPEGGVASVIARHEGGDQVEVGLYGYDGMSGTAVILGATQTPQATLIQIDQATAVRIDASALLDAFNASETLRGLLLRYVQAMNVQAASTASANAHDGLPERLARWLLMCHDRVEGDRIDLTHEFMSIMLAVRRSSVTVTLHTLEGISAIRGTRGTVTVLDRARLEDLAGDSYGEAEAEYRRLVGPFGKGKPGLKAVG